MPERYSHVSLFAITGSESDGPAPYHNKTQCLTLIHQTDFNLAKQKTTLEMQENNINFAPQF